MRKIVVIFIFILIENINYGQKLTFSPEISPTPNDPAISEITTVWKKYISSYSKGEPDSARTSLWVNGQADMLKYYNLNGLQYIFGEQYTFNIRKITDEVYEINTLSGFIEDGHYLINTIYKVCAIETNDGFKLLNYFDIRKESLSSYITDCIEYYYPKSVDFKKRDAKKAIQFIQKLKKEYNISDNNPITYIVAENIEECSSLLGLTYTIFHSEKTYAGRILYPRTLLSARPNHIHELVHAVFIPLYPDAPIFLHEGIATYYGGGAQKNYLYHAKKLKEYLSNNTIDFTDPYNSSPELGETYVTNTIGALLIAYVLEYYGHKKVITLFESNSYNEVFEKLGIPQEDINNFVMNKLIE